MGDEKVVSINLTSKFAEKLLDHCADFVGGALRPRHIKRMAIAEAEAALTAADAANQILERDLVTRVRLQQHEIELAERAKRRIGFIEMRRQRNLEAIIGRASEERPESVSDDPVTPDWLAAFFEGCQDVSEEQMQLLWAKLLAGEVAQPGRFSRRTLDILRTMDSVEADRFARFGQYFVNVTQSSLWHIHTSETDELLATKGLTRRWLMHLEAVGLLAPSQGGGTLVPLNWNETMRVHYDGQLYDLRRTRGPDDHRLAIELPIWVTELSLTGLELGPLTGSQDDPEYWQALSAALPRLDVHVEHVGPGGLADLNP